ncbi:VOC family protein [Paenibacillus sp. N1-5-1-14]|uniref:VOC family protein n=1 Tax=Paenibacillus radicibacter TaxID=2972488 RepID=UPI002158FBF0|nr:VOC family protein [Paenibacillus radicibacter]MCR8644322.1 VOC family protein [Paenibacillus radicibacter]
MSNQQTLRGFATISYWADDVEAATTWYTELLGIAPYFERSGPDGKLVYTEFRIGDYQHELGIINRQFAPPSTTDQPGGVIMYWHVDDIEETLQKLTEMGAKEYDPLTPRGDTGFVTASVVDPFGNVLGVMYNPHYLEILKSLKE